MGEVVGVVEVFYVLVGDFFVFVWVGFVGCVVG